MRPGEALIRRICEFSGERDPVNPFFLYFVAEMPILLSKLVESHSGKALSRGGKCAKSVTLYFRKGPPNRMQYKIDPTQDYVTPLDTGNNHKQFCALLAPCELPSQSIKLLSVIFFFCRSS